MKRGDRKGSRLGAGFVLLAVLTALGVAGRMECGDAEQVEEFRREYCLITDERGDPRVVLASEVADAQTTRQSHPLRAVREPAVSAVATR